MNRLNLICILVGLALLCFFFVPNVFGIISPIGSASTSTNWNTIYGFPAACPAGSVLSSIGLIPTCISLPTDTNIWTESLLDSDNNFLFSLYPASTLTYSIGSGANRWLNLFVQGINSEDINTFNVVSTGDVNALDVHVGNTIFTAYMCDNFGVGCWDFTGDPFYFSGVNLAIDSNLFVDGNYLNGYYIPDFNLSSGGGSGTDTNWQTSWIDFDANMVALYYSITNPSSYITGADVPVNEIDPAYSAWIAVPPNVSTFVNDAGYITSAGEDTNWVTSWNEFDTNLTNQYRKYAIDLNTSENIATNKNLIANDVFKRNSWITGRTRILNDGTTDFAAQDFASIDINVYPQGNGGNTTDLLGLRAIIDPNIGVAFDLISAIYGESSVEYAGFFAGDVNVTDEIRGTTITDGVCSINGGTFSGCSGFPLDGNLYSLGWANPDNNRWLNDMNLYKEDPTIRLTDSGNGENASWTRTDTDNKTTFSNRISRPGTLGNAYNGASTSYYILGSDANAFSFTNGSGQDLPFSISTWFNGTTINTGVYNFLVNKGAVNKREYNFYVRLGDLTFLVADTAGTTYVGRQWSTDLVQGNWYHLVATYDGTESSAGIKLYVNGVRRDDTNLNAGSYTGMTKNGSNIALAYSEFGPFSALGKIDEIMVFDKILSQADIDALYNSGNGYYGLITESPCDTNLVGGWHLDETSGTAVNDFSPNNRDGTASLASWVSGKVNSPASVITAPFLSSENGTGASEEGIITLGYSSQSGYGSRTVLDGQTLRFNISGIEKGRWDTNGYLGIITNDTNRPSFPLQIFGATKYTDNNQVSLKLSNAIVASKFITGTDVFDANKNGSALKQLMDSKDYFSLKSGEREIDHKKFGYSYVTYDEQVFSGEYKDVLDSNGDMHKEPIFEIVQQEGVDLVAEIALIKQALFELKNCIIVGKDLQEIKGCVK